MNTRPSTQTIPTLTLLRASKTPYPEPGVRLIRQDRIDEFLLVVYATPGGVRADYYDSEGHVIRYAVTAPAAEEVAAPTEEEKPAEPEVVGKKEKEEAEGGPEAKEGKEAKETKEAKTK